MDMDMKKYGLMEIIWMSVCLVITKLFYSSARLIRFPCYIRGRKYISIGKGFTTGYGCRIDAVPIYKKVCLIMGENVRINDYVHIGAANRVIIGSNVLIASKVFVSDHNHGTYSGSQQTPPSLSPDKRDISASEVLIGDNVWIGESACILPGIHIGNGSVIGAGAVVTHDIPENSIAVGCPAYVVKMYKTESRRWESI